MEQKSELDLHTAADGFQGSAAKVKRRNLVIERARYFTLLFGDEGGIPAKKVLEDLAKFCRAKESTFHEDPRIHAVLEGRREVYLRIMQHLELSTDELLALYE